MPKLRLAVVGDPVEHSRSPEIFARLFAAHAIDGSYEAIRIMAGNGATRFAVLRADGYTGLNVTTPLKEEAFAATTTHDEIARASGSVNVITFGDTTRGFNTDGAGAIGALATAGLRDLANQPILVLGAGPTARATVAALCARGANLAIWNRTHEKASRVVAASGCRFFDARQAYVAVISTMSPGVEVTDVPTEITATITQARWVIDANYGKRATFANAFARPDALDGLTMLEASAIASFEIFKTTTPPLR